MLDHNVSTTGRTYRYGADALVPFGFGLSFTTFKLHLLSLLSGNSNPLRATGGAASSISLFTNGTSPDMSVKIGVANEGALSGDEVVQVLSAHT